ncbi:hypothetical protein M413DRAFT_254032 [Hebeloma cylindrosporum]|uniref:BTB domain-containing protein n=1 Tax=Hebeloma cylindrosporum TaxID=76867 RepID=A0A0C3BLY1_HEBCY|nr:hypothetical protein M413DRAFT_254032 [Hebeloma cylindrosporum h7]
MAEDTPSVEFYWDNIVIKVEDRLFCVPRCEFVQSSEVFADMFLLPSAPGANPEGRDREHPLVLEGYKKDEFACLLKVMYPTYVAMTFTNFILFICGLVYRAGSLISGTTLALALGKEEWVSVLKLSTIWNMEKIRAYAIHRLSTDFVLSPTEKIHLARAHKVAAWLDEGVTSLVSTDQKPTLADLATLGWETAAQILWIRDNSPHSQSLIPAVTLHFKGAEIWCAICTSPGRQITFNPITCNGCKRNVTLDTVLTAVGPGKLSGHTERLVPFRDILCGANHCRAPIFSAGTTVTCQYCGTYNPGHMNARVTPSRMTPPLGLKNMIEETFGEEIKKYNVA